MKSLIIILALAICWPAATTAQLLNMKTVYGNYAVNEAKNAHLSQTRLGSEVLENLKSNVPVLVVYNSEGQDYVAIYNMAHDEENPLGNYEATPGPNNTFTYQEVYRVEDEDGVRTEVLKYEAHVNNGELTIKSYMQGRDVVFYKYE